MIPKRLTFKIPLLTNLLVTGAVTITIAVAALHSQSTVSDLHAEKIEALSVSTHDALVALIDEIRIDGTLRAKSATTRDALIEFSAKFPEGGTAIEQLRRTYIQPQKVHEGSSLVGGVGAPQVSTYEDTHSRFHGEFSEFTSAMGYYDLFLVNKDGDIVYTVEKEDDFAANLRSGPLSETGIGEVFDTVMRTGDAAGSNVEYYDVSKSPAAFWGYPVRDNGGDVIGALIIQLPTEKFDEILNAFVSAGGTSEAYLISNEDKFLTQPRLSDDDLVLQPITSGVRFAEPSDALVFGPGRSGSEAMIVKRDIDFYGHDVALVYEIATSEGDVFVRDAMLFLGLAGLGVASITGAFALLMARSVVRPIRSITEATTALAGGRRDLLFPQAVRSDEVGDIARALQRFQEDLRAGEDAKREQAEAQEHKLIDQERVSREVKNYKQARAEMTAEIDRKLKEVLEFADELARSTGKVSQDAQTIEKASIQTTESMTTVASAAEELSASVSEINQRTQTSRERIQATESLVEKVNADISSLEGFVTDISEIATLIQGIATKTSLLALNATIESARAGDAGKGFAVVASEVKELSAQTATATHDIARQIDQVREATQVSVQSIASITENFSALKSELMSIIGAVGNQAQATSEIAQSASVANDQARTNTQSVEDVAKMIERSEQGSQNVAKQCKDLLRLISALDSRTDEFFRQI